MELIEYRVRPVTRYVVTRYEQKSGSASVTGHGEFDNWDTAHPVAYALCKAEHDRLGWPIGDERIQYPSHDRPPTEPPEPDREAQIQRLQWLLGRVCAHFGVDPNTGEMVTPSLPRTYTGDVSR
jgi:hypothetical protein